MAVCATVDAGPTPCLLGAGRRGGPGDHSFIYRLLDPLARARPHDVLALHPGDLLLYRTLYGACAEYGRLPYAYGFCGLVRPVWERFQPDSGPAIGRVL